jgi:small subunit ribosomal protein S2
MNHRGWGGTLTNWNTVSQSISRLKANSVVLATGAVGLTKKERLNLERETEKLQASLGGIAEMGSVPELLFVIDVKKRSIGDCRSEQIGHPSDRSC